MPRFQLPKNRNRAKFAVSDHKNVCSFGQQGSDILEQTDLLLGAAVSTNRLDPRLGDRYGSSAIGQADHQQLMTEAYLGAVYDQSHFADPFELRLYSGFGDRLVPPAYIDCFVRQKTA